jgi:hypothetical protein
MRNTGKNPDPAFYWKCGLKGTVAQCIYGAVRISSVRSVLFDIVLPLKTKLVLFIFVIADLDPDTHPMKNNVKLLRFAKLSNVFDQKSHIILFGPPCRTSKLLGKTRAFFKY